MTKTKLPYLTLAALLLAQAASPVWAVKPAITNIQ
jgi:hypothetical protein